jgi:hypothetical protein
MVYNGTQTGIRTHKPEEGSVSLLRTLHDDLVGVKGKGKCILNGNKG